MFIIAPCQKVTYDAGFQVYDIMSQISIKGTETKKETTCRNRKQKNINTSRLNGTGYRYINIYYAVTDVKISITSKMMNLPTFISNVGGNLGLFVGFSVLGVMYFIYDIAREAINWSTILK